jgi:hypothetical protein
MASKIQFGVFELDRDAAELQKQAVLIRLQEQPIPGSIGESRLRLETQHMKQHLAKTLSVLSPLAVLITATACGQGGTASPPPPLPISVAVSPKLVPAQTGTTLQFTANVSNSTNTNVTWEVNGKPGGDSASGTISATGLYSAPAAVIDPPTVSVIAVSQADNSKSDTATVGITPNVPTRDVWFAPDFASADFPNLFTPPDQWTTARSRVKVFKFYAVQVNSSFVPCPDWLCGTTRLPQLVNVQAFSQLKAWGVDIGIEAGAVKPENCSGDPLVNVAVDAVQNVQANGGIVRFIAMDEPFIGGQLTANGQNCNFTMQQSAAQTAHFVETLQGKFIYTVIGDIEPYPYFSVAQLEAWISLLHSLGVQLAFFHLDVDPALVASTGADLAGDLQALNAFCQAQKIPFGVLLNSLTTTSDQMYYSDAIQFTQRVKSAIGKPQASIFQSFDCATGTCNTPINLPENDPNIFSHTRLINDALAILNQ